MNTPTIPNDLRNHATAIWRAGVDSVDGQCLIERNVSFDDGQWLIDSVLLDPDDYDDMVVVGGGKATAAMTAGWLAVINRHPILASIPMSGWVNVPEGHDFEDPRIRVHPARPASVNEPTEESIAGTRAMLDMLAAASSRTLGIVLISGGGSALISAPIDGVTLDDKLAVIRHLSGAGATIEEMNAVRSRLSRVKGGGLARSFTGRDLVTLVLSDVLGDPLEAIASGPTVVDRISSIDPLDVLARFDPDRTLPAAVYRTLATSAVPSASVPFNNHICVVGNNAVAVDESGILAESLGYNHLMHCQTEPGETAEQAGQQLAETILEMLRNTDDHQHDAVITGGEPVVKLASPSRRGRGGRNQQLVLEAYRRLLGESLSEDHWDRIVILSGGTDGEDGPTDAAGAILDAEVHRRAVAANLNVNDALHRNDAYTFFEAAGGLLITGPTGTNVCDLRVGLVRE